MKISLIVAMTPSGLIGKGGKLPWHLPSDLRHFKETTIGHAILMGRKTLDEVGRALPGRRNLVVSRNPSPKPVPDIDWFEGIGMAVEDALQNGESELFVIGGAEIFKEALSRADRMYVTWVKLQPEPTGDTYFPAWDRKEWREAEKRVEKVDEAAAGGAAGELEFITYERAR